MLELDSVPAADAQGLNAADTYGVPGGDPTVTTAPYLAENGGISPCSEQDFVTVLTSADDPPKRLTKRIYRAADGLAVQDYEGATFYTMTCWRDLTGLDDLARVIGGLNQHSHIVNGDVGNTTPKPDEPGLRRRHIERDDGPPTLREAEHYWLPMDLDSLDAKDEAGEFDPVTDPERAVKVARSKLPPEFHDADCLWQLTSGAGIKPGIRLRLFFWLTEPRTSAEVKQWLAPCIKEGATKKNKTNTEQRVLDGAIYTPSQPIYCAPPVIDDGIQDPVPVRSGIQRAQHRAVTPSALTPADRETIAARAAAGAAAGPEHVEFDSQETVDWAIKLLREEASENGTKIGTALNVRAFKLAAVLGDGPRYGEAISENKAVMLMVALWSNEDRIEDAVRNAYKDRENDLGCGPPGISRDFGATLEEIARSGAPEGGGGLRTMKPGDSPTAPPVLSPKAPLKIAREFLKRGFTTAESVQTLIHWRDDWYAWAGTHYKVLTESDITALLYRFLDTARVRSQSTQDGERASDQPFNPDQSKVNKILHALKAEIHQPDRSEPPSFRGTSFVQIIGYPAHEYAACQNGLVHLRTGSLFGHEPGMFNVSALGFAYDPAALCPRWHDFLNSILPGDPEAIDTLQEIIGYIVSGETCLQKLFYLFGPGRCGKGTIVAVLEHLLAEGNTKAFTFKQLDGQHGMQDFIGKSLLAIKDAHVDGGQRGGAVEILKMISGCDAISIPRKYKSDWDGKLPGRILIVSNNRPRLDDDSGVIATRVIPIRIMVSFLGRENPNLLSELLAELPGIFNWARAGWQRLMARGHFTVPASAQEIIDDILAGASPMTEFVEEHCVRDPVQEAESEELWARWQRSCIHASLPCGSQQTFGRTINSAVQVLTKHRGEKRGTRARFYFLSRDRAAP